MTLTQILAALYTVTSFFMGMHMLGTGRLGWAAAFGALFLSFVWMLTHEADRAGERA